MMATIRWMMLLGTMAIVVGCGRAANEPTTGAPAVPASPTSAEEQDHSHGEGPHGGVIADWGGGEYHVEFVVDHDAQEATVYVLDGNAKSPAPIGADLLRLSLNKPMFQMDLNPVPLAGESEGSSSRFVGKHEKLGVVQEFSGTISGVVEGTPFAGDFEE